MTDASRAVGVVSSLLSNDNKAGYVETVQAEYARVADAHRRAEADKQRLPLAKARANAQKIDWAVTRRRSRPSRASAPSAPTTSPT